MIQKSQRFRALAIFLIKIKKKFFFTIVICLISVTIKYFTFAPLNNLININKMKKFLSAFLMMMTLFLIVKAQSTTDLNANVPMDPNVRYSKLSNGMTYYIMRNTKPEHRAEFRLAVNVGSTQENDDQQGLAHFTEHMSFNGTTHFAKNELIDYIESIGSKFGADLNAYTSFDETVYMLQIPTDSATIVDKAFVIFEDWAHNLSFDHTEIDKERGVVVEEWRLGQGANVSLTGYNSIR